MAQTRVDAAATLSASGKPPGGGLAGIASGAAPKSRNELMEPAMLRDAKWASAKPITNIMHPAPNVLTALDMTGPVSS
jgi:hypothetical protein